MSAHELEGFDYRTQRKVAHARAEWSRLLRENLAAGGERRVENGETFAHDKRGILLFEVYANVPY